MTDQTVTLAEVEQQEARARALAAEIAELRQRERTLSSALAEVHATGEGDVEALTAERRESVDRRQDLESALPIVKARVVERREAACRVEAEARLLGIARAAGSLVDHARKDTERIARIAQELAEAVARRNTRQRDLERLQLEAEVLALRFGLTKPDLPRVAAPRLDPAIGKALEPARKASPAAARIPFNVSGQFRIEPTDENTVRIRGGVSGKRSLGGETGRILAAGGAWQRTSEEAGREAAARTRAKQDEQRAELDALDDWLRAQLAAGPVLRERVIEAARAAELRLTGPREDNVWAARHRLDVRVLHRLVSVAGSRHGPQRDNTADYWALPGGWPEEEYVEYAGRPGDTLAGMRG